MKMKIFYINKTRLYDNMPSTVFSMLNAYSFAENGADVTIILKSPKSEVKYDFESFFDLKQLTNFQIVTISDTILGISSNEIFYWKVNQWIKAQSKPDIILTRDPGYLPFLYKLKKQIGSRIFYQSHNFYLDTKFQPHQKKINQNKFHKFEKKYLPALNGMFTLNNSQKELYGRYVNIPTHAIVPGLQKIYSAHDNFEKKKIVYSGSLQMKKGVDILLHSFAKIDDPQARLVLIGGRHKDEILPVQNLARDLNISDRVHITGWVSFDQVNRLLSDATLGIIPLKNTFYNQYLTAPSKLFDYIGHGIPVIASDLPSIRDIDCDGNSIIYTDPDDSAGLTIKIDNILSNYSLYKIFSKKSHELANNYLWKDCGKRMMDSMTTG